LADPGVPDEALAAWIDAHTMRVHARLLDRRNAIAAGPRPRSFVLPPGDKYYAKLLALPPTE
jgi:hypothetical protein